MAKFIRNVLIWVGLAVLVALAIAYFKPNQSPKAVDYTTFIQQIQRSPESIHDVVIGANNEARVKMTGDAVETVQLPAGSATELTDLLLKKNIKVSGDGSQANAWPTWMILLNILPVIFVIIIFMVLMRQAQSGGSQALSFGRSRAKLLTENRPKVTFADVAGVDEAKQELAEVVEFLKYPKKFQNLGARIPKGLLLLGPPGSGKTLLARAIAGEAGVPFFSIAGSDFVEMFVGVGASRARDLFVHGKKHAPCIIFIDEIDAVGRHRGAGLGGGHDEREQTLNQLLVEMDGFEANEGVILVAATNRPDVLDPALLRPGRFDPRVVVPRPDVKGREGILKVHTRKVPLSDDVDIVKVARSTPGFAGADLENLVNEAALLAARRNKEKVEMTDFELAKDKVLMGAERRSLVLSLAERRNTAYHESGHALVAMLLPGADPVHKVTIIPRGMALGITQQLPLDDRYTYTRDYLMTRLSMMFGGRVAEELVFGQTTTGAGDDIEKATELARKMVCQWGMSVELGPMTFGRREEQVFLGRDIAHQRDYSEHTAIEIDREVRRMVDAAFQRARKLLTENLPLLHAVSDRLLEKEVLDGGEVAEMVKAYQEGRPFPASTPLPSGGPPRSGQTVAPEKPKPAGEEAPALPGLDRK